ncbi:hypothetical protein JB92DRAFT_2824369 [Gautieria morchelliformis]|nr:hypothetical protein JB92DRAFT_2824369 [Gautieria morchelliformis]
MFHGGDPHLKDMDQVSGWPIRLIPTIVYLLLPAVLFLGRNRYVKTPARGSIIIEATKVLGLAYSGFWSLNPARTWKNFRSGANWDAARPAVGGEVSLQQNITWDSSFVDEIRRTLFACKVFLLYPLFWISYNQISSNLVNQAGFDPIAIIIIIPTMVSVALASLLGQFSVLHLGSFFAAAAMVYAAVLQACCLEFIEIGRALVAILEINVQRV